MFWYCHTGCEGSTLSLFFRQNDFCWSPFFLLISSLLLNPSSKFFISDTMFSGLEFPFCFYSFHLYSFHLSSAISYLFIYDHISFAWVKVPVYCFQYLGLSEVGFYLLMALHAHSVMGHICLLLCLVIFLLYGGHCDDVEITNSFVFF